MIARRRSRPLLKPVCRTAHSVKFLVQAIEELPMFSSIRFGVSGLVLLLGATFAEAEPHWSHTAQREQIHQQYLTPGEHRAVHGGGNYGATYGQPAYRSRNSDFGWNHGNSGYGYSGYGNSNYGNTAYGNSGNWNGGYQYQYQPRPSYSSGSGYGNSGYSQQFGGHFR